MGIVVRDIIIYPVKSCRGIRVPAAALQETGLAHDRQWMLVDEGGRFVTQRSHPAMAHIAPRLEDGQLYLQAPGMREGIGLPVDGFDVEAAPRLASQVFDRPVQTRVESRRVNQWLSDYLKQPVRLVRFDAGSRRGDWPVDGKPLAGDSVQGGSREGRLAGGGGAATRGSADGSLAARGTAGGTRLADAHPLLIASMASLRELNRRLAARGEEPVEMLRFRPNIVVDGDDMAPHAEDSLNALVHAGYALQMMAPCARCATPNLNPATGQFGAEPTRTLREYRLDPVSDSVLFGMHALVAKGAGMATIRVGDVLLPS